MGGGYGQSSEQMSSTAGAINSAVSGARDKTKDLEATQLQAAEFGRVHKEKHQAYVTGFDKISGGLTACYDALDSFAAKISGNAKNYQRTESGNEGDVAASGGG